jgi:hypothetical protein
VRDDLISLYCRHTNKLFRRESLKKKLLTLLIGLLLVSLLATPMVMAGCGESVPPGISPDRRPVSRIMASPPSIRCGLRKSTPPAALM